MIGNMNIFRTLYQKTFDENEKDIKIWEDHLQNLQKLELNVYAEKLKVPVLVPIGGRILFRGELKHTNEVTVALSSNYFAKCSVIQAEELRQHRIKVAQKKLAAFLREKEFITNRFSYNQDLFETGGQEIVEVFNEEEDLVWREKHKQNLKLYKQSQAKETVITDQITDEELWNRLDELELLEELDDELEKMGHVSNSRKEEQVATEDNNILLEEENAGINENEKNLVPSKEIKETLNQNSKLDLLQQVLEKQDELENKLTEIKDRERPQSKTEEDLIERLDEIEQLDELQDEIDRLDDIIIENNDTKDLEAEVDLNKESLNKKVSFADEDDGETLELTFTHSDAKGNNTPYNPKTGIMKPSDIYEIYSYLFTPETPSILKKNGSNMPKMKKPDKQATVKFEEPVVNKTIVVKDIVEKPMQNGRKTEHGARPTSLFKKKRMQNRT